MNELLALAVPRNSNSSMPSCQPNRCCGNPELRSLNAILKATGLTIAVKPIERKAA